MRHPEKSPGTQLQVQHLTLFRARSRSDTSSALLGTEFCVVARQARYRALTCARRWSPTRHSYASPVPRTPDTVTRVHCDHACLIAIAVVPIRHTAVGRPRSRLTAILASTISTHGAVSPAVRDIIPGGRRSRWQHTTRDGRSSSCEQC